MTSTIFGNVLTAQAERERLEALGLEGVALEWALKLTAPERREARVSAVLAVARVLAVAESGIAPEGAPLLVQLLLELAGEGGRHGLGRWSPDGFAWGTARHLPGLGKGRRHAGDGPAWDAAVEDAWCHAARGSLVCLRVAADSRIALDHGETGATVAGSPARVAVLARACLRAVLAGRDSLPLGGGLGCSAVQLEGSPAEWGRALALADRERRGFDRRAPAGEPPAPQ